MTEHCSNANKIYGRERVGWLKKKSQGLFPRWQRRFARISEDDLILLHNPAASNARRYKIACARAVNHEEIVVSTSDGSELRLRFSAATERDVWLHAAESCAAAEDGTSAAAPLKHQADLVALVAPSPAAPDAAEGAALPGQPQPQSLHFRHRVDGLPSESDRPAAPPSRSPPPPQPGEACASPPAHRPPTAAAAAATLGPGAAAQGPERCGSPAGPVEPASQLAGKAAWSMFRSHGSANGQYFGEFASGAGRGEFASGERHAKRSGFGSPLLVPPLDRGFGFGSCAGPNGFGSCAWPNGDTYVGEWRANAMWGYGRYAYADGSLYVGQFVADKKDGQGTLKWANGDEYAGEWKEDAMDGEGTLRSGGAGGGVYIGTSRGNLRHGHGHMLWPHGDSYTGQWEAGKMQGFGVLDYADGGRYDGQWHAGLRHGHGTMTGPPPRTQPASTASADGAGAGAGANGGVAAGDSYTGAWRGGVRHGRGTCTYANGDSFEGLFVNDRREGYGVYRAVGKDGRADVYSGMWRADAKEGIGRYVWADGDVYEGAWSADQRCGVGRCVYVDADVYEGEWRADMRHGWGRLRWADGGMYQGSWVKDVISPGVRGMHPMPPGLYSDLPPYPPLSAAAGRDGSVAPGVPSGPADAAAGAADAAADAAAEVLGMLAARVWGGGDGGDGGRSMSEVLQPLLAGPLAAHMSAVHWMDAVLAAPPPPPPPPRRTASGPGVQIPPPDQAINGDAAAAAATAAAEGGEKIKGQGPQGSIIVF